MGSEQAQTAQEAAIAARLEAVSDAFSDLDLPAFRAFFHLPCHVTTDERVSCLTSESDFEGFFGNVMNGLRERGFAGTMIAEKHVEIVSASIGVASVLWHRFRADYEVFERIGAIYTLVNHSGAWKITALVSHTPETVVAFD